MASSYNNKSSSDASGAVAPASGSGPGAPVKKPATSFALQPKFKANQMLAEGLKLLDAVCTLAVADEKAAGNATFVAWYNKMRTENTNFKILFDCRGKYSFDKDGAPLINVTRGMAGLTSYTLSSSKVVSLNDEASVIAAMDPSNAKGGVATPPVLTAYVDLAFDFPTPIAAAWCIAHELTLHVMPLYSQRDSVQQAIEELVKSGISKPAADSRLKTLLTHKDSELSGLYQHLVQISYKSDDYLQAWKQMLVFVQERYKTDPVNGPKFIKAIHDAFKDDIQAYTEHITGKNMSDSDFDKLSEVSKRLEGAAPAPAPAPAAPAPGSGTATGPS